MPTTRPDQASAMLDRVSSLLATFDGTNRQTLAEIARKSRLPRSSVHRILQRLAELGWIERQGTEYGLGLRMFELGSLVVRQDRIHRVGAPYMLDLHRRTGFTVHLSILRGSDVLHTARIGGSPVDEECWQVGVRCPAQYSAAGRALLADLEPAERPVLDLAAPPTRYSLRTRTEVNRELQKIRDYGVALDHQGQTLGFSSVATTIGAPGHSSAALSLTGPADLLRPDRLAPQVHITAADIWLAADDSPRTRRHSSPRRSPAAPFTLDRLPRVTAPNVDHHA
ncbi:IclR family transcriptional regulator [Actinomadura sp. 9N407]|uniref:IclR family transcriptional regulator n=1 Tax=Actinomadura sp. 9N407 TaxID=3375154 RepID=UPI003791C11C